MSKINTPRTSIRQGVALAVAAFMAFGAVANASAEDTKDKIEKTEKKAEIAVSDSWITTKVKSEILANSLSKAFKVSVTTKYGVVMLKGELPTQDSIDLVKMIAEKVKGVKSVDVSGLTKVR
jgi:hyperosmotically inducible protein